MCLSVFYLTIKLYLWDLSCQFSAAEGHLECVSTKRFLSALAWTEWLTGSLLETSNPHISLCSHTGQYIARLSLIQPFSFTHHFRWSNCSTMPWRKWFDQIITRSRPSDIWTRLNHITNADNVLKNKGNWKWKVFGHMSPDERLNRLRQNLP